MEYAIRTDVKMNLTSLATRRNVINATHVTDLFESNSLITQSLVIPKNTVVSNVFTNSLSVSQVFLSRKIIYIFSDIPFDLTFNANAGLNDIFEFRVESFFTATVDKSFKIRNPSTTFPINAMIVCG